MDIEKACENCIYYKKHYIIYKTKLKEVGGGCIHIRVAPYNRNKDFIPRTNCKYWEDGTPAVEERRERALNEISKIKRTLSEIALILKSEK